MSETLIIPRFGIDAGSPEEVEEAFRQTMPRPIACNNWTAAYPDTPVVTFRMFHTGTYLFLRYDVAERWSMASVTCDQGEVWTDSCAEFFLAPDDEGYYNFEANCIGTLLLAFRRERPAPAYAPGTILQTVRRMPTLGPEPFAEREGNNRWSLTLAIPPSALFRHDIASWSGLEARMNLYKCGDKLSHPHFLSWKPVRTPQPDFHRPEFFASAAFE